MLPICNHRAWDSLFTKDPRVLVQTDSLAHQSSAGGLVGTTSIIIEQLLIILTFYLHCWGEATEWEPPFRKNGSAQGGIACYRSREVQVQLLSDLKIRWTSWEGNDSSLPGGLLKVWAVIFYLKPSMYNALSLTKTCTWDHGPWLTTS